MIFRVKVMAVKYIDFKQIKASQMGKSLQFLESAFQTGAVFFNILLFRGDLGPQQN